MMELLWLLLPVAAASGWWVGRRAEGTKARKSKSDLSPDYYKGLNYLLNEQQDKALEVFLRLVEADSETIETHLALAGLFRRRGEVERAIRIHQNLLARPSLEQSQRSIALLELGKDYMHAGLFDRAESLFSELVKQRQLTVEALRNLLGIYQREHEWHKAIETARKLIALKEHDVTPIIAHCYCEISVEQRRDGAVDKAIYALHRALDADTASVRANILLGDLYLKENNFMQAHKHYFRVFELDKEFIPEVLEKLTKCIANGIESQDFDNYVQTFINDSDQQGLVPGLALYIYNSHGEQAAVDYINRQLQNQPSLSGLKEWVQLEKTRGAGVEQLDSGIQALDKVMQRMPGYQCRNCGYTTTILYWQCPGCKSWSTIKPSAGTVNRL